MGVLHGGPGAVNIPVGVCWTVFVVVFAPKYLYGAIIF